MKVAFIGNSHIAAYRAALDQGYKAPSGVGVVFFGSPGQGMAAFGLEGTTLCSADRSVTAQLEKLWGSATLDIADIDVVVLTGMGVGIRLLGVIYKSHRSDSMAPGDYLVSDDTFRQAAAGLHRESVLAQLARGIRGASPAMVVGIPQPLPSEEILTRPNNWVAEAAKNGDGPRLAALAVEFRRDELGLDLVIEQPEETLASPLTTKRKFMVGAARLNVQKQKQDDHTHANAEYGALVMDRLFASIAAWSATRSHRLKA